MGLAVRNRRKRMTSHNNQRSITMFTLKYRWLLFADWLYRRIFIDKDSQYQSGSEVRPHGCCAQESLPYPSTPYAF